MTPPDPQRDDIARIERSMRSFRRIGNSQRAQRRLQQLTGVEVDASAVSALFVVAEGGPLRLTDLAEELWLDISVVSRKLRQLEDLGFVGRVPDPDDARAVRLTVLPAGAALVDKMVAARSTFLEATFEDWSAVDVERFAELFDRFMHGVVERYQAIQPD